MVLYIHKAQEVYFTKEIKHCLIVCSYFTGIRSKSAAENNVKMNLPRRAVTTYIKSPSHTDDAEEDLSPVSLLSRVTISPNASFKTKLVFTEHL